MIDLSPIEPTQCILHTKRLVDAWLEDPTSVDGCNLAGAQFLGCFEEKSARLRS